MTDNERSQLKVKAVHVSCSNDGDEYHAVGLDGVTEIKWGWTSGHMAALQTLQVFKGDNIASEHPFSNVLSVHYDTNA